MLRDKKQLEDALTSNTKEIMRLKLMQVQHYKTIETSDFDDDMKYEFVELSPFKGANMFSMSINIILNLYCFPNCILNNTYSLSPGK